MRRERVQALSARLGIYTRVSLGYARGMLSGMLSAMLSGMLGNLRLGIYAWESTRGRRRCPTRSKCSVCSARTWCASTPWRRLPETRTAARRFSRARTRRAPWAASPPSASPPANQ
eukprot:5944412-Pyramimonas_sp.AAC.1